MKPIIYVDGRRIRARGVYRWQGKRLVWRKELRIGARVEIIRPGEYLGYIHEPCEPKVCTIRILDNNGVWHGNV